MTMDDDGRRRKNSSSHTTYIRFINRHAMFRVGFWRTGGGQSMEFRWHDVPMGHAQFRGPKKHPWRPPRSISEKHDYIASSTITRNDDYGQNFTVKKKTFEFCNIRYCVFYIYVYFIVRHWRAYRSESNPRCKRGSCHGRSVKNTIRLYRPHDYTDIISPWNKNSNFVIYVRIIGLPTRNCQFSSVVPLILVYLYYAYWSNIVIYIFSALPIIDVLHGIRETNRGYSTEWLNQCRVAARRLRERQRASALDNVLVRDILTVNDVLLRGFLILVSAWNDGMIFAD